MDKEKLRKYKRDWKRNWVKENPDKARFIAREDSRKRRIKNGDGVRDYMRAYFKIWYRRNKKERLAYHSEWYKKNKEKVLAWGRRWRKNNPEKAKMISRRRHYRAKNAIGNHSQSQWEILKASYNYMCLYCKKFEPEIKLTEDHIIPLSLGGTNNIENIQPLCLSCNSRKGKKINVNSNEA